MLINKRHMRNCNFYCKFLLQNFDNNLLCSNIFYQFLKSCLICKIYNLHQILNMLNNYHCIINKLGFNHYQNMLHLSINIALNNLGLLICYYCQDKLSNDFYLRCKSHNLMRIISKFSYFHHRNSLLGKDIFIKNVTNLVYSIRMSNFYSFYNYSMNRLGKNSDRIHIFVCYSTR